jgi:hypothetical protein
VQSVIDGLGKYLTDTVTIYLTGGSEDYDLTIEGFIGPGSIHIICEEFFRLGNELHLEGNTARITITNCES